MSSVDSKTVIEVKWGTYYCLTNGQIDWAGDEVAVAFDPEAGIRYRLGPAASVTRWAKERGLAVISGKLPVEDLNRMLENSTWQPEWLRSEMAA